MSKYLKQWYHKLTSHSRTRSQYMVSGGGSGTLALRFVLFSDYMQRSSPIRKTSYRMRGIYYPSGLEALARVEGYERRHTVICTDVWTNKISSAFYRIVSLWGRCAKRSSVSEQSQCAQPTSLSASSVQEQSQCAERRTWEASSGFRSMSAKEIQS